MKYLAILSLLETQPDHGKAIQRRFSERTGEELANGTVYVYLDRMESAGLIALKRDGLRITCTITASGRGLLDKARRWLGT